MSSAGIHGKRNIEELLCQDWNSIYCRPRKKFMQYCKIIPADCLSSKNEKKNEDVNLDTIYINLKLIYENITNLKHYNDFSKHFESVRKCFEIIEHNLTNDLIEKIKNENINKQEKIILDCIMSGTSILCELSDDNDEISLKIADDDVIMSILCQLVDKLSNEIKPFSISDQLIENIVFICLNVSRRSNKTKINDLIEKLKDCIHMENINHVIKVGVALTIAYVGNVNNENILIIKQLIIEIIDKINERKADNWCGLSLNEINEGFKKLLLTNHHGKYE